MQIKSLGYRTDLFFPKYEGMILDRGDYLVILTPTNPGYFRGNYLLFSNPPIEGDFSRWQELFSHEISSRQETHHRVYGWDSIDGETGEVKPFLEAGFSLMENIVLTAEQVVVPPKYNTEVEIRPISTDWEWEEAVQNEIICHGPVFNLEHYTTFKRAKMDSYRQMTRARLGEWFGAFYQGHLVADLGLYCEDKIARFQSVKTHPDYRRRGICSALVYQASRYGFERMGASQLVMIADEHYFAARIYETIGFRPTERQVSLEWWERAV